MRFPLRVGLSGGGGFNPWSVLMWYRGSRQISASTTATSRYLHEVDLAAAAGSVTLTLPATGPDPTYVGVVNASSVANGSKVVIIQTAAAVEVVRLSAAGESVWLGRNPITGAWELLAHDNPSFYQWTFANAAARMAASVSAAQVGQIGYQSDLECGYQLLSVAPARWGQVLNTALGPIRGVHAVLGTTSPTQIGVSMSQTTGSAAVKALSGATRTLQMIRYALTTGAAANSATVYRNVTSPSFAAATGLWFRFRFAIDAVSASVRHYVGISTSAPGANVDPNTLLNAVGVGRSGSGANMQLYNNDGAGVGDQTDLGATYPSATADVGYEFQVYSRVGVNWIWQLEKLDTGDAISGTLTTNVPSSSVAPIALMFASNNADASVISIDLADIDFAQLVA